MGAELIAIVVVVVVILVGGVVFLRMQLGAVKDAAGAGDGAPFLFGVPPPKRIMAETSWPITVAGQPATVSVTTQYRGIAASPGPAAGTLWLEVSLGPEWPAVGVRPRDVAMSIGRSLGRRAGLATTEVGTGDPAFDARYWSGVSTGDPARARAVLTPTNARAMADPPIAMMDCSRTLVLQYPLPAGTDPNSLVPAAARCAETIIRSSGIPVYSGPPWQYVPPPARA